MGELPVSVAALLIAEACNVGLVPVTDPNIEALTRGRLSHVDQNYLRAETHAGANAQLIAAQAKVPLARLWGGGLLASVDGLRFVVPVRTLGAGPSPKYFGYKRGLTWLNAVNDQVSGIGSRSCPAPPATACTSLMCCSTSMAGPNQTSSRPTRPLTPTWCSGSSRCWATGSPHGSPISATPATGGPAGQARPRPTTGR